MKHLFRILLLVSISLLIWWKFSVNVPFLWDDDGIIKSNPYIGSLKSVKYLFDKNYFIIFNELSYRPVVTLSHILDNAFIVKNSSLNHLTNLIFHILNAVLVYLILVRLFGEKKLFPVVCAVFFAVNPLHIETLGIAAFRDDILMTFFFLLAFLYFLKFHVKPRFGYSLLVGIFLILSLFSKETALIFLPVAFFSDILIFSSQEKKNYIGKFAIYMMIAIVGVIFLTVRFWFMMNPEESISGYTYFVSRIPVYYRPVIALATAFRLCLLPVNLIFDYNNRNTLTMLASQGIIIILFISLFWKAFLHDKIMKFGLLLALLPLIPILGLYPIENFFANRYVYLPLFGFSIIIVRGCFLLIHNYHELVTVLVTLILSISLFSLAGKSYFSSDEVFAQKLVNDSSYNYKALNYLGTISQQNRDLETAQLYYEESVAVNPNYYEGCYNLSSIHLINKEFEQAHKYAVRLTRMNSYRSDGYRLLGDIMLAQNNDEGAVQYYSRAIEKNRFDLDARNNLGTLLEAKGLLDEAGRMYSSVLELSPNFDVAWSNLGNIAIKRMDYQAAVRDYHEALKINPANAVSWYNLGNAYYNLKNYKEAKECYTRSLELNPSSPEAMYNLAVLYMQTGDRSSAIAILKKYVAANPQDTEAKKQLEALQK